MVAKYLIPIVLTLFYNVNSLGHNEMQSGFALFSVKPEQNSTEDPFLEEKLENNLVEKLELPQMDSEEMLAVSGETVVGTLEEMVEQTTEEGPTTEVDPTTEVEQTTEVEPTTEMEQTTEVEPTTEMEPTTEVKPLETVNWILEHFFRESPADLKDFGFYEIVTTEKNLETTSSTSQAIEWISTTLEHASTLSGRAVVAGHASDGGPVWVIRAPIKGDLVSGKLIVDEQQAFIPYNMKEHSVANNIEVFCAPPERVQWVESHDGSVPPNAVVAGSTGSGEKLYVGRTKEQGLMTPGKVHPSHKVLYIPFNGKEIHHKTYEVLCLKLAENNVTILERNLETKLEGNLEENIDEKPEEKLEKKLEEKCEKKLEEICEKKLEEICENKLQETIEKKLEEKFENKLENLRHNLEEKVEKSLKKTFEHLLEDKLKNLQQNLEENLEKKLTETIVNILILRDRNLQK